MAFIGGAEPDYTEIPLAPTYTHELIHVYTDTHTH